MLGDSAIQRFSDSARKDVIRRGFKYGNNLLDAASERAEEEGQVIGCIILAGVFYAGAMYTYWRGEITLRGTGKVYKGDPRLRNGHHRHDDDLAVLRTLSSWDGLHLQRVP